jgi:hypothetical protein
LVFECVFIVLEIYNVIGGFCRDIHGQPSRGAPGCETALHNFSVTDGGDNAFYMYFPRSAHTYANSILTGESYGASTFQNAVISHQSDNFDDDSGGTYAVRPQIAELHQPDQPDSDRDRC